MGDGLSPHFVTIVAKCFYAMLVRRFVAGVDSRKRLFAELRMAAATRKIFLAMISVISLGLAGLDQNVA